MAAPKGNQFWKARTKHGRDKLFEDPEKLGEACAEYFQWVEDNPLWEHRPFHYQGDVKLESVPKMRAMTISGLCLFLDITTETWYQWRKKNDFSDICSQAETIIYNQKLSGAAADMLNASIIARELGLADKSDHTSSDGTMSPAKYSDEELDRRIEQHMQALYGDQDGKD